MKTRLLPVLVIIGLVLVLVLVGGTSVPLAQAASYPTTIAQWTQVSAPGGTWNLLLFGGWTPPYVYRGDSWLYDGVNWRDATPVGPGPASRSKAGMAYDAARNRVVLFGGLYDIGNDQYFLNDTWQYADGTWTELHPPLSPSTRGDTLMVYDSRRDVMVLFGGGQNYRPAPQCTADNADTDTWEYYDETWHQVVTVHSPPRFRNGVMAYDEARGKVVLFTGFQACGFGWQNETWEYDGHDWARIPTAGFAGTLRYDPGMAYDANRQRVVLFGGYPHGQAGCSLNDTWEYDGVGWTRSLPVTAPSGRCSPAMAYDPGLGKVVMFAGGADVPPEDTWEYDGVNWQQVFPQLHPPSRGWGMMAPIRVAPANRAPVLTVDQASVTVDEGQTATNSGTVSDPDGDPVTLSASIGMVTNNGNGTWSWALDTTGMPVGFQTVAISADDGNGMPSQATFRFRVNARGSTWNLLLFGGRYQPGPYTQITWLGDTWTYDGSNWSEVMPVGNGPAPRSEAGMAYDPVRNRIVLFGGMYDIGSERHFLNDTWEYANGTWTELHPPLSPSARGDTQMVYDSLRDVMVLFGGGQNGLPDYCTAENAYADTWEFDGTIWSQVDTAHQPPRFRGGAMAYDEARGKVVLFTGFQACGYGWENQTWEYDGDDWTFITNSRLGGVWRYAQSMAYDASRKRVVLFGGYPHGGEGCSLNDTWEYDGTAWIQITPLTRPSGRCSPAMGYDPGLGKVVIFSGCAAVPPEDTWTYDGTNWQQVFPQVHPPSRGWGMMAPILVAPANRGPVLTVNQTSVTADEGQTATNTGMVSDPDGDPVTLSASSGTVANNGDGTWSWSYATSDGPSESQTVTILASDGRGGESQAAFELVVNNTAPTVEAGPNLYISEGQTFSSSGRFTDPGVDTWTATVDYGDGSGVQPLPLNSDKTFNLSHTYADSGGYTVQSCVTDDDGGTGCDTAIVTVAAGSCQWHVSVPNAGLSGVWGSSGKDIFAVGGAGTILHYDGSAWSAMDSGTSTTLSGVWGSSGSDVFVVGGGPKSKPGIILHYDGAAWSPMSVGSIGRLMGVWGTSASDVFAVGINGIILHYDGSTWSTMSSGTGNWLYSVWGTSGSDVFAVGGNGTILHYDGSTWSPMGSGAGSWLSAVWGSSGSNVFAVGDSGTILHYDGSIWSGISSGVGSWLYGAWGSSGSNVFAVGGGGTILHYDGSIWSAMNSGTENRFAAVWGTSGGDVFTVAQDGPILHWQCQVPNTPPTATPDQALVTVDEGQTATNALTVSDPDGDPVTLSASIGPATNNGNGTWSWSYPTTDGPNESQTVTILASDGKGGESQATFGLVVNNVAPTVSNITAPVGPVQGQTPVDVSAGFSDPGILDTHTAVWDWGDGTTPAGGTVIEANGSGTASGDHTYLSPGVYTVKLTVTDKDGGSTDSLVSVTVIPQLTVLNPAGVWIGLKNSDDVGTRFDLRAEVYQNGTTLIATGQLDSVWGGSSGFNNARLNTIPLALIGPVGWPEGSTLTFKLYVRNTCYGHTHNSGTARLWYNDTAANSRFGATIGTTTSDYFLRDGFALSTTAGPGPKKTIDIAAGAPCSPFKLFGTWSTVP